MRLLGMIFLALLAVVVVAQAGEAMLAAQQKLKTLGYYKGTIDGQYGSQTAAAIRRYQLAEKLKVTGELNPQTSEALGIPGKTRAEPAGVPSPDYVSIAEIFKGGPYAKTSREIQIATIREAQRNLKLLGYYTGPLDGRPSAQVLTALKSWQQSAGFRESGRLDENTLKGLGLAPN